MDAHASLVARAVGDAARLTALHRTRLLDSEAEESYDRIAQLASTLLAAPIATVTLIDQDRQFYKACVGLPEPISSKRETPLEYSFCRHTIGLGTPLVIEDTAADDRVAQMPSVIQYGVRAYAGIPLMIDGQAVGTLCVMDMRPREWADHQIALLRDLGAMVMTEIELRMAVQDLERATAVAESARGEAERANRAKSEFVAMMSHDVRTPLNAIGGYRQLLEMGVHGPINERQREALSRIKRAEDHMAYLIAEVLDFSRLESGSVSLTLEAVPVESVLRGLEALIRPQLDDKRISYVFRTGDRSVKMYADSDKVVRVLTNLLGNSIKFTPSDGSLTVAWTAGRTEVSIAVSDTGIGIPENLVASIFEPFVQIPGQKELNPGGVGLGLAIGRKLAQLMGGDLTASSRPGEGTTMIMTVPRAADANHLD